MRVNPPRQFLSQKCLPSRDFNRPGSSNRLEESTSIEIGDYRLHGDYIGKGAFSKVYSAKNTITKEQVAVKLVRTRDLQD